VPDQAAEESLLAAVELLYRSKVLPAALEHISIDQVGQARPGGGVLLLLLLLLLALLHAGWALACPAVCLAAGCKRCEMQMVICQALK
jgi:hypothetical protein